MSLKGAMRMAMYTELREACIKDGHMMPMGATPAIAKFIKDNVDYLLDMQAQQPPNKMIQKEQENG